MIPSAATIADWLPELNWNLSEARRILATLADKGTDPPNLQAGRRRELMEATR